MWIPAKNDLIYILHKNGSAVCFYSHGLAEPNVTDPAMLLQLVNTETLFMLVAIYRELKKCSNCATFEFNTNYEGTSSFKQYLLTVTTVKFLFVEALQGHLSNVAVVTVGPAGATPIQET